MKQLTAFCVSLLLVAGQLRAETAAPPPTPALAVFEAWLKAFNSGELATIQRFHQEHGRGNGGDSRDAQRDLDMSRRTGGFDLQAIENASAGSLSALLRERASGRYGRVQLEVGQDSPARIIQMRLQPAQPPTSSAQGVSPAPGEDLFAGLHSHLQAEAAADRFSGAVLVAKDGVVQFERAYGLADRDARRPNLVSSRFRIGSMNKMFTAVAILQLVEAGRIGLDDPLVKFLPNYPNRELAREVTIDQLLNHRGGTGDIFVPEYFAIKDSVRTLDEHIALLGMRAAAFPPGERFEYSNYGYILLGAVIEKVTGRSYYDWVQSQIFDRAGMPHTGSEPEAAKVEFLSTGYTRNTPGAPWRTNTAGLPYRGTSAGGGYSTVRDLLAFAQALSSNKLLGADYTRRMMQGLGLRDMLGDGSGFVGHNGGSHGMNGDLRIYPRSGTIVIALANIDPPAADAVTDFVDRRLPRQR